MHLISFMDHTPGQGQYRDLEMYRGTIKGYRDLSDEEIDATIVRLQGRAEARGIDDPGHRRAWLSRTASRWPRTTTTPIEKLAFVRGFGATISEFPITIEAAREARRLGMRTVIGAPNILLGGSHSGNLSATEAVLDGSRRHPLQRLLPRRASSTPSSASRRSQGSGSRRPRGWPP